MNIEPPQVEQTPQNQPWWDALTDGQLLYQACACGNAWMPPRMHCPRCLGTDWRWARSAGGATLLSWVVFRTAYHAYFKDRLPYNVVAVQLDEGPRLISSVVGHPDGVGLRIGQRLKFAVQAEGNIHIPRFAIDSRA
jgi:uncharacterized OB-fold protein